MKKPILLSFFRQLQCQEVNVLITGHFKGDRTLATKLSKIEGVSKVFVADKEAYAHGLAESYVAIRRSLVTHFQD